MRRRRGVERAERRETISWSHELTVKDAVTFEVLEVSRGKVRIRVRALNDSFERTYRRGDTQTLTLTLKGGVS